MARAKHVAKALTIGKVRQGLGRLRSNWMYIIQIGLAAGLAFGFSHYVIGHALPFFAPMSAVIVYSAAGDRVRKSMELVVGVTLGVGVGDGLIYFVGTGAWQIAVGVAVAVALATFVDRGALVANHAAFAAVLIATILPPETSGGTDRMVDSLVGGMVALLVMALLPASPLRNGRREVARILGLTGSILDEVAQATQVRDAADIARALERARGSQANVNKMITEANNSREVIFASPLLVKQREDMRVLLGLLNNVDNAMRNTRVLSRRAHVAVLDSEPITDELIELLRDAAELTTELSDAILSDPDFADSTTISELTTGLRRLAAQTGVELVHAQDISRGISTTVMLAQVRSLLVDLMGVCGCSHEEASSALIPTTPTPGYEPNVWKGDC
ncbi:FUSC family protein [Corynebacterium confusum]